MIEDVSAQPRTYKVLTIDGEPGFYVACEHRGRRDWLRIIAWFPTHKRADSYRDVESWTDEDGDDVFEDAKEPPPTFTDNREPVQALAHLNDMGELSNARLREENLQLRADLAAQRIEPEIPALEVAGSTPAEVATQPEDVDERLSHYSPISQASGTDEDVTLTAREARVLNTMTGFQARFPETPTADDMPTLSEIADKANVSRGSASIIIDALERKGCMVRRGERGAPIYEVIRTLEHPKVDYKMEGDDDAIPFPSKSQVMAGRA